MDTETTTDVDVKVHDVDWWTDCILKVSAAMIATTASPLSSLTVSVHSALTITHL